MKYGLIGEKLGHSFSKIIHESIAGYTYELKEIAKEDLDAFMKEKDFCGINVTIPYKASVIPYLDYIDSAAEKIGAVNTIVNKDGKLYGYNTDFGGMKALIEKAGFEGSIRGEKIDISGFVSIADEILKSLFNLLALFFFLPLNCVPVSSIHPARLLLISIKVFLMVLPIFFIGLFFFVFLVVFVFLF